MSRLLVRLRCDLVEQVRADLARPHPFAFERVGFLYGRTETLDRTGVVVLVREFESVPDSDYLPDRGHGATIGTAAIRRALAHALETGDSILHVHEHLGPAGPSSTDRRMYRELTPTYVAAAPAAAHGGLILGSESAYCVLWPPGGRTFVSASARVVGFPLAFWETSDGL
jgi:hypothetical protein